MSRSEWLDATAAAVVRAAHPAARAEALKEALASARAAGATEAVVSARKADAILMGAVGGPLTVTVTGHRDSGECHWQGH